MPLAEYTSRLALLGNVIDYAGIFPPASLALDEAVENYATFHHRAAHPWLISKFTLPLQKILSLEPSLLFEKGSSGTPWLFTALGTSPEKTGDFSSWIQVLWSDFAKIAEFNRKMAGTACRLHILGYETKLLLEEGMGRELSDYCAEYSKVSGMGQVTPYFELDLENRPLLAQTAEYLTGNKFSAALKVRLGGGKRPAAETLANAIELCSKYRLKFKATQGLHHAISSESEFGFVNLLAAINFSFVVDDFGVQAIADCLAETDPKRFRFEKNSFHWNNSEMSIAQIEKARSVHQASFGSCSADEPDEELKKLFS